MSGQLNPGVESLLIQGPCHCHLEWTLYNWMDVKRLILHFFFNIFYLNVLYFSLRLVVLDFCPKLEESGSVISEEADTQTRHKSS